MDEDQQQLKNQQIVEQKLEWIKRKTFAKKQKRESVSTSKIGQNNKKEEEKAGCAVYIRLRPDNIEEQDHPQCIQQPDSQTIQIESERQKTNTFRFNKVFDEHADQKRIFEEVARPLVKDFINGFNESILVYGQSGSGKTHTILGPGFDNPHNIKNITNINNSNYGLVPRVVESIFQHIEEEKHSDKTYDVRMSYIEIYNEKIKDLLYNGDQQQQPTNKIYNDKESNLVVCNATQLGIEDSEHMLELVKQGSLKRVVGETELNVHSSRSHGIVVLTCLSTKTNTQEQTASQMLLIDLAGTENIERSGAQGLRMKEACNINTSLLSLGNVIDDIINLAKYKDQLKLATCEKQRKNIQDKINNCHIGYRDSLLTRLLENCLGGNSYTRLICCSSKSSLNYQETLSTLRFGARASQINNKPKVNKKLSAMQLQRLLDQANNNNKALQVVCEYQSDLIDHYQQVFIQVMGALSNRHQLSFQSQLAAKLQALQHNYHQHPFKKESPQYQYQQQQQKQDYSKLVGKYSLLKILSFLDLMQIVVLMRLSTQVYAWTSRANGFWLQQLKIKIKNKQLVVSSLQDISDYRLYLFQFYSQQYMLKQKSKIKSNTAGLNLFKGTAK